MYNVTQKFNDKHYYEDFCVPSTVTESIMI